MVHNGIEYGLMAAYAEGLNVLKYANVGKPGQASPLASSPASAEVTPLRHPEYYQFDFNLADVAEVWRRGSVISSWLLDLTATALQGDPAAARASPATCQIQVKAAGRSWPRWKRARRCRC